MTHQKHDNDEASRLRTEHGAAVELALAGLDLDEKAALLGGQDEWSLPAMPHIGLRSIVMSDGPIGVRGVRWTPEDPSVALPCPTALAASWDPLVARRAGRILGQEARVKGVHVVLGPTINLHRSPLGGRHFECYSEDPVLTAQIAAAYVSGVQAGGVATTPKHFVANEAETERFTVDNIVSERALRELYLAPFEAVVNAGTWGLMSAYNAVNGTSMTVNAAFQRDLLRGEWGYDGFVVSDWLGARDTAGDILGGMDVAMPGPGSVYGPRLAAAVRGGEISEALVDEAVRRVLLLAARVGCLRGTEPLTDAAGGYERADQVARQIATRGSVLLANPDGLLPLDPTALRRIAVAGDAAARPQAQGGGAAKVFPKYTVSLLEGLRAALEPATQITHVLGTAILSELEIAREGFELRAVVRDVTGNVLADVPLPSGEVQWTGSDFPEGATYAAIHSVELTGTFTPACTGAHDFGTKAIGSMHLRVGGKTLFNGVEEPEGTGDPLEAFFARSANRGSVDLVAGTPVAVRLSYVVPKMTEGQNQAVVVSVTHRDPERDPESLLREAETEAACADVAVVVVSTTETVESEGADRKDLRLPGRQDELVRRVSAANPRTVVVVNCGAPVEMPWRNDVAAVLLTWFPGQEGGHALADMILGNVEPGGRLPTTWAAKLDHAPVTDVTPHQGRLIYEEDLFIGYRAWDRSHLKPAYWFGHGLGYTCWSYESLRLDLQGPDQSVTARVTVRNIGARTGREVIQIYLSLAADDQERPDRWLAGFASVEARPGEEVTVTVQVPCRAFQTWSAGAGGWVTRPGDYRVHACRSAGDVRLTSPITIRA
jgi:beta-glucosidase